jgi:hypothetical protein
MKKLSSRLHFLQRRDAAPMRCGDATVMRRRCDRAEGDATAQKPAQKLAQKPAQYAQVFFVTNTSVGMCRYFLQNTCT